VKVLLMSPLSKEPIRYPHLGLGYLATYIRDAVDNIEIFIPKKDDDEASLAAILRRLNPNIVGISVYSLSFRAAQVTAGLIKKANQDITVIAGGPHPSGDPEGTLNATDAIDYAFQGEAETGLRQLVRLLSKHQAPGDDELSQIPGLVWRRAGGVVTNAPAFIDDLDTIGFPAYDLLRPDEFRGSTGSGFMRSARIGFICASRGCPRRCTFCAGHVVNGRTLRKRDPRKVVEEMELLYREYGIREVQFTDPDISLDTDYLREICEAMVKQGVRLHWSAAAHSKSLDTNLLALMRKSGCYMLRLGVESGSERISRLIKKGVDFPQVEEMTRLIRKRGIHAHAFFILGLPTETLAEMKQTLELSKKLDLDSASFAIFQPLPGSEIYESQVKSNPQIKLDWDNFNYFKDAGFTFTLPFKDMKRIQRKAYLDFYLRPKMIIRTAKKFLGLKKLAILVEMVKRNLGS